MIQTPSTNSRKERGKNSRAFGRAKSEGEGVERLKEKETERERETIVLSRFVFVERKGRALLRCARAGSLIQKQSSLRQPGTLFAFPITQTQPIQPVCRTGSSPPHLGRNTPPPADTFWPRSMAMTEPHAQRSHGTITTGCPVHKHTALFSHGKMLLTSCVSAFGCGTPSLYRMLSRACRPCGWDRMLA